MNHTYETLLITTLQQHVLHIALNRPDAANAISTQVGNELAAIFTEAAKHPYRAVILTGKGKNFCAGADLKERKGMSESQWNYQHEALEKAQDAIHHCPVPVIAAVHGAAFGGGLELALACDFIYATRTAQTVPDGETLAFWRHMSDANLVDGQLGTTGNSAIDPATGLVTANVTTVNQSLPDSRTTPTNSFIVYSASGLNYFQLLPLTGIATTPAYTHGTTGLTPIQSFNIDQKLDDGRPVTGIVVAKGLAAVNANPTASATSGAQTCMVGGSPTSATATYNRVAATGGNDGSCSVRFRFN